MHWIDYCIFGIYMAAVLAVGIYHFRRNSDEEDYFVGKRDIKPLHVGLSIVATDVGGGFSIGLGGAGFIMGLSGSWLLFTGLVGAWFSAVFIIPKIKRIDRDNRFMTYPDFLEWRYDHKVALLAALISGIGYLGFTGAQILAGAKLASATILQTNPFDMEPLFFSLLTIAVVTILYTVIGGIKAVIYTDTVQWIILMGGLVLVTVPVAFFSVGGIAGMKAALPASHFSLTAIAPSTFINWMVTIIPIWIIGMTLYQRMYACRNEEDAQKAWYTAGLFEYPVMAFTGVFLGMCARVFFPDAEPETALPMLIRDILPAGVTGLVIAAYFSAIMSTADSCLVASSGNFTIDIIKKLFLKNRPDGISTIRLSMIVTLVTGVLAVVLAARFSTVLDAILMTYSFMVSGLFVPTMGAYFWKKGSSGGALAAMSGGGSFTILLSTGIVKLPDNLAALQFDATVYGIMVSALLYLAGSLLLPDRSLPENETTIANPCRET
ncbi:MAG: sodium:solute symporter family protein [Chlorobium sp.]|uniref:sodium:solute symporter family protein n=1 Tax=Chlorobium sp. TaxID=1095 RepID=UPI001DE5745C|nr:sodium:solute symporter family protein [Chlorobium sp.]MBN1278964.1 sodium:solute symporter family protein [Chlorobiaceae bacterium]MCF8216624.1 sodium:solute symporter family protein [Chlorobium sp.]MCF8271494.1 sodium:solute symporter family protein [Chlorobium sp.]MCF8287866.1 sodium:solute symporter family protein [Chlorobium sp.]MCF8291445.1 sodium:solute symporter family protein [Chlorobium sp.]